MALGIREIGDKSALHVAWGWACNGAAGVLGTNICMIVMIYFGMSALFWIGAGCYLFACFLAAPRIERHVGKPPESIAIERRRRIA